MSDEWVETTLGDIADIVGGGTPSTKEPTYWNGDVVWLTPTEVVKADGGSIGKSERCITQSGMDRSSAKLLPAKTVLLTSRASVGFAALASVPLTTNQGFQSLIAKPSVLPEFLLLWIQGNREEFRSRASGSTFPEISKGKVASIPIILPPLAVQRRIVDLMGHLDSHLASLRTERDLLEHLGAAVREESLFGDEMVLGDVIRGIRGGKSPLTDGEQPSLEEDGVLKVSAVTPRRFVAEESKRLPAGHGLQKEIEVRPGDVLITRANTPDRVGAVCRVPDSVRTGLYLCDKTLRLDVDLSRVDPDYLVEALNTQVARQHLTSAATGTSKSMFNISQDKIRSTPIVVPDRSSQTAYARRLHDLAALLSSLDQELQTLSRARQSLITALLSGVLRIPAEYDSLFGEMA